MFRLSFGMADHSFYSSKIQMSSLGNANRQPQHRKCQYERNAISSFGIDGIGIFGRVLLPYRRGICK
jgi:hypothetical protein